LTAIPLPKNLMNIYVFHKKQNVLTYFSYDANMNKRKYFPKENIEKEDAAPNECPSYAWTAATQ
jgi:hypothetical protein